MNDIVKKIEDIEKEEEVPEENGGERDERMHEKNITINT